MGIETGHTSATPTLPEMRPMRLNFPMGIETADSLGHGPDLDLGPSNETQLPNGN